MHYSSLEATMQELFAVEIRSDSNNTRKFWKSYTSKVRQNINGRAAFIDCVSHILMNVVIDYPSVSLH